MAIGTPLNIGTANYGSSSAPSITLTAAVPAGAHVVLALTYTDSVTITGITDTAANTYSIVRGTGWSPMTHRMYVAENVSALAVGDTITVSFSGASRAALSAMHVTGLASSGALDVSGSANGNSAAPSASTSAASTQADAITIGSIGVSSRSLTVTQPSGFATPFTQVTSDEGTNPNSRTTAGGHKIETTTGVKTYNPTLSALRNWAAVVAVFKAATSGGKAFPFCPPMRGFIHMLVR